MKLEHVDKSLSLKEEVVSEDEIKPKSHSMGTKIKNAVVFEVKRNQYRRRIKDKMVKNCLQLQKQTIENKLVNKTLFKKDG